MQKECWFLLDCAFAYILDNFWEHSPQQKMYENPELLLSAELQLILLEILCRKRIRTFTAKNFKRIALVFCTCWLFSLSFHHNFSPWNLLTPYKILKATF